MWDLVPWPGIEPGPLHWEHWVLSAVPPGKSLAGLSLTLLPPGSLSGTDRSKQLLLPSTLNPSVLLLLFQMSAFPPYHHPLPHWVETLMEPILTTTREVSFISLMILNIAPGFYFCSLSVYSVWSIKESIFSLNVDVDIKMFVLNTLKAIFFLFSVWNAQAVANNSWGTLRLWKIPHI